MEQTLEQKQEASRQKLIARMKQNPQWELQQELGSMMRKHINEFTPTELKRYNELKELLKKSQ